MMKIVLCLALLSVKLQAATEQVITVEDVSGGPISFTGSIHFQTNDKSRSRDGTVKGTNMTSQEIIAISATVNAPGITAHYTHDFFSKAHGLMPGDSFSIPLIGTVNGDFSNASEEPLFVRAVLVFVQFADGTVWGDQKAADKMSANRQQSEVMLRNLLDIYQKQGEKGFVNALKSHESGISQAMKERVPSNPDAYAAHLLDYYNQFGATATIENIQERLHAVAVRRATGKF